MRFAPIRKGPRVAHSTSWAIARATTPSIDAVDLTVAPLLEHPSRNVGLKLDEMFSALKVLASGPGLVAITLAELNPHNAASDEGLLERFAARLAQAISRSPDG